jgi:Ca-activated chloride channel family protein
VAQVFCPLTLDHGAAKIFLDILEPGLIGEPGTALGDAIRLGNSLFEEGERKYKVMVVITDGEDQETDPLGAAREVAEAGVILHTIGVGTGTGEPIPLKDAAGRVTDYVRDAAGQVVTSRLDAGLLAEMARLSGGTFYLATPGEQELDRLAETMGDMDRKELSSRLASNLEDRFQVPLLVALLALGVEALLRKRGRRPQGSMG